MARETHVAGVALAEVDERVLDASLRAVDVALEGSIGRRVAEFAKWVLSTDHETLADCSRCRGAVNLANVEGSDVAGEKLFAACPYCGEQAKDEAGADPDGGTNVNTTIEEHVRDNPRAGWLLEGTTGAKPNLSPRGDTRSEIVTEQALDDAVQRVKELKAEAVGSLWALGRVLAEVRDSESWRLRRSSTGEQAYTGFDGWVRAECGFTRQHAYRLIDVAQKYDEETIREIGPAKLTVMAKLPPADEKRLLEAARNGASKRELEQEAKKAKEGESPPGAAIEPPREPAEKQVTCVLPAKPFEVQLAGPARKDKQGRRREFPCRAEVECMNGTTIRLTVRRDRDGNYRVKLTPKRVE